MLQTTLFSWFKATSPAPTKSTPPERAQVKEARDSSESTSRSSGETSGGSNISSNLPFFPPASKPAPLPPLPNDASIESYSECNQNAFKRLISVLLPIPYPDKFFRETLNDPVIKSLSLVGLWNISRSQNPQQAQVPGQPGSSQLVAGIRCLLMSSPPHDPEEHTPILYISTIGTLSPFRRHSIASHLLHEVTLIAVSKYHVTAVMAHVWEANEDALAWYKRRGFEVVARDEMYYRRLAPKTAALIVRRDVKPSDLLCQASLGMPTTVM